MTDGRLFYLFIYFLKGEFIQQTFTKLLCHGEKNNIYLSVFLKIGNWLFGLFKEGLKVKKK